MRERDQPACPVLHAADDNCSGLTKYEHTVIEMVKAHSIALAGCSSDTIMERAIYDAGAIWDALEKAGEVAP